MARTATPPTPAVLSGQLSWTVPTGPPAQGRKIPLPAAQREFRPAKVEAVRNDLCIAR